MSSTYGPRVTDAISGLRVSAEQATDIHDQIGTTMRADSEIGGETGLRLAGTSPPAASPPA